ncbi:HNH endonuclease signature motif containing protein [Agromyces sp. NPDC058484]|uniref:HNH endonuclease signature motif containing protein n=1 Tax=Agromyces sp. NPDC058484 TaxID=3346524 RepID=UPI0036617CCB
MPGCSVPASWCEIHHVIPDADGGPTHPDNGVLLCWFHHRTIDTSGWGIRMFHGVPHIRPPVWLDPGRTWRPATKSPTRLADQHDGRERTPTPARAPARTKEPNLHDAQSEQPSTMCNQGSRSSPTPLPESGRQHGRLAGTAAPRTRSASEAEVLLHTRRRPATFPQYARCVTWPGSYPRRCIHVDHLPRTAVVPSEHAWQLHGDGGKQGASRPADGHPRTS